MDSKKKIRKHVQSSSSSSDDDDSSSSSSSSSDGHHKKHRTSKKQRDSSSSSDGEFVRKSHKHQHKKSSIRKHSHSAKLRAKILQANVKKVRSMSPESRAAHKHHLKLKLAKKAKHLEELDRHSARRSPVRRDVKKDRTPEHRINSPTTRIRVSVQNNRVQDRAALRSVKDSPSTSRRYVRETIEDRDRGDIMMRQKEHEKMRRIQEEEHYKYTPKVGERPVRQMVPARMTPDKYHRERSRSHGRIPIRERLDKEYEYRRSDSREHDEYPIVRSAGNPPREQMDRPYDYRSDDRRIPNHEYGQSSRGGYEDRHHRWDENRANEPETRGNRMYEGGNNSGNKNWEPPIHERKRIPDDAPYKDRSWNESSGSAPHDKWSHKDKEVPEWKQRNWKDQPQQQIAPTMPHPRRWPGPSSDNWNSPRGPPIPHKIDPHSSSGPPFKPRGNAPPYFGHRQRFPYKRFPSQYSKINFPSKRVLPSSLVGGPLNEKHDDSQQSKSMEPMESNVKFSSEQENTGNESGELTTEAEEEKIAQPDTTFSGLADPQYPEECEGNLSEFSDVDDDILNREEIEENSSSQMDVQIQSQSSCTTSTASRAHNRIAYVNNRIFSPFSSDYYCIYGLLPRHADDDDGKCELARASAQENQQHSQQTSDNKQQIQNDQQISSEDSTTQDPTAQKMISKIHANKELKKEMDLDFEEISDGELEQESAIKGFGDALGVDWASLAKETQRPINKSSEEFYDSTKSRWTAHRILWDIGISVKFAGEDFAREKLMDARNKLRDEKYELRLKKNQAMKEEKKAMNGDIKQEEIENGDEEIQIEDQDDFELDNDVLTHPLAQVQVLMRKLAVKRRNLILNSTGKYGRALSARKDIKLRRQMCNLPTKDLRIDRSCISNPEINKHADEIYRKLVEEVN